MQIEVISRVEAQRRGLAAYYTGNPCLHGHLSHRSVNKYECVTCRDFGPGVIERRRERQAKQRIEKQLNRNQTVILCRVCAKRIELKGGKGRRRKFCDKTCGERHWRVNRKKNLIAKGGLPIDQILKNKEGQKQRIAARAAARRAILAKLPPLICLDCGLPFERVNARKKYYCSQVCGKRASGRISVHLYRQRRRGQRLTRVSPTLVMERDGWLCHICGVKTEKSLRGTPDPRAPEMDHIIPISKGGAHSYANTACSCRLCNWTKGVKAYGQPSLFACTRSGKLVPNFPGS